MDVGGVWEVAGDGLRRGGCESLSARGEANSRAQSSATSPVTIRSVGRDRRTIDYASGTRFDSAAGFHRDSDQSCPALVAGGFVDVDRITTIWTKPWFDLHDLAGGMRCDDSTGERLQLKEHFVSLRPPHVVG